MSVLFKRNAGFIEAVPGHVALLLALILVIVLISGRLLDIMDTASRGIEKNITMVFDSLNATPRGDYGEMGRGIAYTTWRAILWILSFLVVLVLVGKMVNAIIKTGEE